MDANSPPRVLLLASKRGYQTDDYIQAAEQLGIPLIIGTDRCHMLAKVWPEGAIPLNFRDPDDAARTIAQRAPSIAGIVALDETTTVIAALARRRLGLREPTHKDVIDPVRAATTAANKLAFREQLRDADLPQPAFFAVSRHTPAVRVREQMRTAGLGYPIVLKPLHLSASRGVMRVDDDRQLTLRLARLNRLLDDSQVQANNPQAAEKILIEAFVAGREVAFEGLVAQGELYPLAIFDKPDPLDGPFFAETIYVTPSTEPSDTRAEIIRTVQAAARTIGTGDGPVHAELRLSSAGPMVIDFAARPIGGLCGRSLHFASQVTLEQLILCHAAGRDINDLRANDDAYNATASASGVYMLPVPEPGVLTDLHGVDDARALEYISDVQITARVGERVLPLPEGNTYMGFIFARAEHPEQVTHALRLASQRIRFHIARSLSLQ